MRWSCCCCRYVLASALTLFYVDFISHHYRTLSSFTLFSSPCDTGPLPFISHYFSCNCSLSLKLQVVTALRLLLILREWLYLASQVSSFTLVWRRSVTFRKFSLRIYSNALGILNRSLSQAQHISQFLEVMIQLLNRGSAAVRHFVIWAYDIVTLSRSKQLSSTCSALWCPTSMQTALACKSSCICLWSLSRIVTFFACCLK